MLLPWGNITVQKTGYVSTHSETWSSLELLVGCLCSPFFEDGILGEIELLCLTRLCGVLRFYVLSVYEIPPL